MELVIDLYVYAILMLLFLNSSNAQRQEDEKSCKLPNCKKYCYNRYGTESPDLTGTCKNGRCLCMLVRNHDNQQQQQEQQQNQKPPQEAQNFHGCKTNCKKLCQRKFPTQNVRPTCVNGKCVCLVDKKFKNKSGKIQSDDPTQPLTKMFSNSHPPSSPNAEEPLETPNKNNPKRKSSEQNTINDKTGSKPRNSKSKTAPGLSTKEEISTMNAEDPDEPAPIVSKKPKQQNFKTIKDKTLTKPRNSKSKAASGFSKKDVSTMNAEDSDEPSRTVSKQQNFKTIKDKTLTKPRNSKSKTAPGLSTNEEISTMNAEDSDEPSRTVSKQQNFKTIKDKTLTKPRNSKSKTAPGLSTNEEISTMNAEDSDEPSRTVSKQQNFKTIKDKTLTKPRNSKSKTAPGLSKKDVSTMNAEDSGETSIVSKKPKQQNFKPIKDKTPTTPRLSNHHPLTKPRNTKSKTVSGLSTKEDTSTMNAETSDVPSVSEKTKPLNSKTIEAKTIAVTYHKISENEPQNLSAIDKTTSNELFSNVSNHVKPKSKTIKAKTIAVSVDVPHQKRPKNLNTVSADDANESFEHVSKKAKPKRKNAHAKTTIVSSHEVPVPRSGKPGNAKDATIHVLNKKVPNSKTIQVKNNVFRKQRPKESAIKTKVAANLPN